MSDANLTTQTPNSENDKLLKGLLDFRMPTSSGQVSAPRFPLHSLGGTSILPFLRMRKYSWARKLYVRTYHTSYTDEIKSFENTAFIPSEKKDRIRKTVAYSIAEIHSYQTWEVVLTTLNDKLLTAIIFFPLPLLVIIPLIFSIHRGILGWVITILTAIISLILSFVIFSPFDQGIDLFSMTRTMYFLVPILINVLLIETVNSQYITMWLSENVKDGIVAGLVTSVTFICTYLLVVSLFSFTLNIIWKIKARRHPVEEIIQSTCLLLGAIENNPEYWGSIETKIWALSLIEWIAKIMERDFPRMFSCKDIDTHSWFNKNTRDISSYFRRLKRHILLSKEMDRELLLNSLSVTITNFSEGNWGNMPTSEVPISSNLRSNFAAAISNMIVIAIPLTIVAGLHLSEIPLTNSLKESITGFVALWTIMYILNLVQPHSDTKNSVSSINDSVTKTFDSIKSSWQK